MTQTLLKRYLDNMDDVLLAWPQLALIIIQEAVGGGGELPVIAWRYRYIECLCSEALLSLLGSS